jgi:hypothetical protein
MLAGGVSLHFPVHPKLETLTKSRYLKTDREKIPVITIVNKIFTVYNVFCVA